LNCYHSIFIDSAENLMKHYFIKTAHRFPFSLFNESKRGVSDCTVVRTGDVTDQMDRSIGRPVIKIKGIVSANNSVDISNLSLTGVLLHCR
jgi:hypothetical protein